MPLLEKFIWITPHSCPVSHEEYTDEQWEKICGWSSMRLQTLWRTVAGMMLYHPALQCHYEVQGVGRIVGERKPALAQVWTPNDCFTCIVSMQQYANFEPVRYKHTNQMFAKFPSSLKVAYIDQKDRNVHAEVDNVHPRQHRRYFSCLIDGSCADVGGGRRAAKFTVELPGYPILGDGKSDNQNHAIIFLRGIFSQCIDANQGGYFEQMLMLPCVLGEFRTAERGDGAAKQIIGLPEHITSDIGSVGDFAAGSEVAFGTILQRTYAVLGARMHYGHPDIMNKQFMIQQGGVSKATKTINLSEDIFAGMDFTSARSRPLHQALRVLPRRQGPRPGFQHRPGLLLKALLWSRRADPHEALGGGGRLFFFFGGGYVYGFRFAGCASGTVSQLGSQSANRAVSQSVGQPTERPGSQSAGRPAEAVSQSASQSVSQPSGQAVSQPVVQRKR